MTTRPSTRRGVGIAIVAAVGLMLAGGVGAVAVAKTTKVKACVDSHGYLATATKHTCPRGTHALNLGTNGPRGPRGKPGAKGHPGTSGLSQVFVGVAPQDATEHLTYTYATELATPSAPAGNYVVNWSLVANNTNETADARSEPECEIAVNGSMVGSLQATTIPSAAAYGGTFGDLAQTQVVSLTSPGEIDLQCDLGIGTATNVLNLELNAIRVDTATPGAG